MPKNHPEIEQLHKALAEILPEDSGPGVELVLMTGDEFLAYAQEQLTKARDESPEHAAERLRHLHALTSAAIAKNAFDADGAMLPVYTGDLSRQAQTAYSEQAADHTEKGGSGIAFGSANTEANPQSNWAGRGSPPSGGGSFSFRGQVGKAALRAFADAHEGADPGSFKAALLGVLDGKDPEAPATPATPATPASTPAAKAECEWPRDLNADEVDTENQF